MAQKRARLTDDNNPLRSKTDDFLDELGQVNRLGSQSDDKLNRHSENKSAIKPHSARRKATFNLSEGVLKRFEKFHLQLQLEWGKADVPSKEAIVEEAICQLLDQAEISPDEVLNVLRTRQESRD